MRPGVWVCTCAEAEGYRCGFPCGPTRICAALAENCERDVSDGGVVATY